MATRLPASQRTREELTALIEGRQPFALLVQAGAQYCKQPLTIAGLLVILHRRITVLMASFHSFSEGRTG
jgi:hypothetical protein